jgi:hypothetical protein
MKFFISETSSFFGSTFFSSVELVKVFIISAWIICFGSTTFSVTFTKFFKVIFWKNLVFFNSSELFFKGDGLFEKFFLLFCSISTGLFLFLKGDEGLFFSIST